MSFKIINTNKVLGPLGLQGINKAIIIKRCNTETPNVYVQTIPCMTKIRFEWNIHSKLYSQKVK